nr:ATP-binding protein [Agrobacterium tumefaciens]
MSDGGKTKPTVSIRPGSSVLSVFRHLNYKPWFALAEFVDNAVQSYLANVERLKRVEGRLAKLTIKIRVDKSVPGRITIQDNAAGIPLSDFPRAFRPAVAPLDASGLSEFGMGMKSAACWFSPIWSVRTKALGEDVERLVRFDVATIVRDELEELSVTSSPSEKNYHFTEVVLEALHHPPAGRTLGKIKAHLCDIYRVFIREGVLDLWFDDELLKWQESSVLIAPYSRTPDAESQIWKKEIRFDLGEGQSVTGYAALRDPGNFAKSGFALFRRGRLIEGSVDEGYRPPFIFGSSGSFRHLRLFGELHLKGFEISHTKDGFRWDEDEQPFLELLKEHLDAEPLPLLKQADLYRALASKKDRGKAASEALSRTADVLATSLPEILPEIADKGTSETSSEPIAKDHNLGEREFTFAFRDDPWRIVIRMSDDPSEGELFSTSNYVREFDGTNVLEVGLNMAHPFAVSFAQTNTQNLEALLRIACGLAVGEHLARASGVKGAGTVRRNLNDVLKYALSKPSILETQP